MRYRMLDGKIHESRSIFLDEHEGDKRQSEPADERPEFLGGNVRHEQPSTDDTCQSGRQHSENKTAFGVLAVRIF
jgi:hypothetical protein